MSALVRVVLLRHALLLTQVPQYDLFLAQYRLVIQKTGFFGAADDYWVWLS
jgi:hypothetical protein